MLVDQTIAKVLEHGLHQGADFAEVFIEDSVSRSLDLLDRKIDQINSGNSYGIGIRLLFGHESCYGYSSDPDPAGQPFFRSQISLLAADIRPGQSDLVGHGDTRTRRHHTVARLD